jgi:hypothetical protein
MGKGTAKSLSPYLMPFFQEKMDRRCDTDYSSRAKRNVLFVDIKDRVFVPYRDDALNKTASFLGRP